MIAGRRLALAAACAALTLVGAVQDPGFERRAAEAIAALARDPAAVEPVLALLRESPRYLPLHRALVATAERQGDWLRALRGWRQIEEISSLEGTSRGAESVRGSSRATALEDSIAVARVALAAKAWDIARCQANRVLETEPSAEEAWMLLARTEAAEGRHEAALGSVERALALGERSAEELLLEGELLYRLMRIPEAIPRFVEALALEPEAAEQVASFALSSALSPAASSQSGSTAGSGATAPSPASGQEVGALRALLEEQAANPDHVNTRYALGVLAMREGRAAEARRWLEPLAERLDRTPVHYNLALAYRALGDSESAARALARFEVLEAEERRHWEERNRADRLRGEAAAARRAGDARGAVELWRQADATGSLGVDDLLAWGETLLELGDASTARVVLGRALEKEPASRAVVDAALRATPDARSASALRARAELLDPESWRCGG